MEQGFVITSGEGPNVSLSDVEARLYRPCFDAAMVSGCPVCHSRVVAALALRDSLDDAPPLDATNELRMLIEDAPTLHLYVIDRTTDCSHSTWRDPGYDEWADIVDELDL